MIDPYSDNRDGNPYAYYEETQRPEEKVPPQGTRILSGFFIYLNFIAMPVFYVFLSVFFGRIQHFGLRAGSEIGVWPLFKKLFLTGFYTAPLILFLIYAIIHFIH